jgi:biotin operon repressor
MQKQSSAHSKQAKTTKDAQKVATRKQGSGVTSHPHCPASFSAEEAQETRDKEYEQAWADWAATNSKEYRKAAALGIGTAHIEHSSAVPQPVESDEKSPLDFASCDPIEMVEEEEIILQEIAYSLAPGFIKPKLLTSISKGLAKVKKHWDKASASREADALLELLYLLGTCRSSEMRMKSYVLRAIIAREELSLADIAREYGVTRAAVSKTAVELKRFLGLQIHTTTRNEAFVNQCKERAERVHKMTKADRERAKAA